MKREIFIKQIELAKKAEDIRAYIINQPQTNTISSAEFTEIYFLANASFKELQIKSGWKNIEIQKRLGVPARTVENWIKKNNTAIYTKLMFAELAGIITITLE